MTLHYEDPKVWQFSTVALRHSDLMGLYAYILWGGLKGHSTRSYSYWYWLWCGAGLQERLGRMIAAIMGYTQHTALRSEPIRAGLQNRKYKMTNPIIDFKTFTHTQIDTHTHTPRARTHARTHPRTHARSCCSYPCGS